MSARRSSGSNDSKRYYEWLDKAQADLQSARLLTAGGGDRYSVVFHCHQVAEKALKGYLLFRTQRHYDGHNITFLVRRAMRQDEDFSRFLEGRQPLNSFYISARYPTDIPLELDEDKIRDMLQYAVDLYRLIASKLRNEPEAFYSKDD